MIGCENCRRVCPLREFKIRNFVLNPIKGKANNKVLIPMMAHIRDSLFRGAAQKLP